MVRLEALLYLEEIARTSSITKAADNLFLSKSSVSAAIKNLEEELGAELLKRSSQGTELSVAGEMVVKKSKIIFELLDQMKAECWVYKECAKQETISCYMPESFANNIFPALIKPLRRVSGGARIVTKQADWEQIIEHVKNAPTNIGFYLAPHKINVPMKDVFDVEICELNEYRLWVVTTKYSRYISDQVRSLTMEELYTYPLIRYVSDDMERTYGAEYKEDSAYIFSTDNMNIYLQAIINDVGVGIISGINLLCNNIPKNTIRLIPLSDVPKSRMYLIFNKDCPYEIRVKYEDIFLSLFEDVE